MPRARRLSPKHGRGRGKEMAAGPTARQRARIDALCREIARLIRPVAKKKAR
jgi:hypothetical protein